MVIEKTKLAILLVVLLVSLTAIAQPKSRIDFDRLLSQLPDLPWDFEIRYVVQEGPSADMLRIYYDGRADVVRWRPEYAGSLASVCHGHLDDKDIRGLLELLRDKKFNELPSDADSPVAIALSGDATVSVRLGRTVVRKIDRRQRENAGLRDIESVLDQIATGIVADSKSNCDMESVPAKP